MYVILPADELILMTYGPAIPRLQPRPTLDCLPEPKIPFNLPYGQRQEKAVLLSSTVAKRTQKQEQKEKQQVAAANKITVVPQQLPPMPNSNDGKKRSLPIPSSRLSREQSPAAIGTVDSPGSFIENSADDVGSFGINDYSGRIGRDRSPSIFLEPPSPDSYGGGASGSRPVSPTLSSGNQSKSPKTKSKLRPKIHLSLGRLGRQQTDRPESNRLREDLHIHVENPTFTRENLRERNFDAFFESGEPVYKLQPKTPATAPPIPEDDYEYPDMHGRQQQKLRPTGDGGLFARSPREGVSSRSKSADRNTNDDRAQSGVSPKDSLVKSSGGQKGRSFFGWRGPRCGSLSPQSSMASYNGVLKDYGHSNLNEAFKSQNNVNFKLIKTVSDFTETLSQLYEEHATALQTLVTNYRKKNGELRKERPSCHSTIFQAWETFLQEVENDSQASNDVANSLSRQVSRPMLDKSFHRKVQSRKIFTHRESFDTIIAKTEEKLSKCRLDYKQCHLTHRQNPTQLSFTEYIDAHNAYVQQLHATNAMLETYHCDTIPQLMQELEEIHTDLCSITAESICQGADAIANKASEQAKRYTSLISQCNSTSPPQDLLNFVRILPLPSNQQKVPKRVFASPQPLPGNDVEDQNDYNDVLPVLRNELVFDRHSSLQLRPALDTLKREAADLDIQIRQLQDTVDSLNRNQSRNLEGQLYNKVNELQEDLSMKKFDLRAKQLHYAAVKSQKDLFNSKVDPGSPRGGERKLSAVSATSMKTKWLKAFRSLKPASGSAQSDRRNGASSQPLRPNEDGSHHLQEYTYKKITACDVCSQILRGHTRQGLRCRMCKLNSHTDCAPQLPRCQPKQKLLRRQKSTSELESRADVEEERIVQDNNDTIKEMNELSTSKLQNGIDNLKKFRQITPRVERLTQLEITDIDQIYRVLKQAGDVGHKTTTDSKSVQQQQQKKSSETMPSAPAQQLQDIPTVNVPECPERGPITMALPRRSAMAHKSPPVPTALHQQHYKGLSAPAQDISSCSDYHHHHHTPTAVRGAATTLTNDTFASSHPIRSSSQLHFNNNESGLRRRMFAGFRPLSGFGRLRHRSPQNRSISLPETPHSPQRQKLNLRMKSLSLDSPESSELHGQIRRRPPVAVGPSSSSSSHYHGGSGGHLEHSTPPSNNSRLHSPSSPSHQGRKHFYGNRGLHSGSVDLPDEIEKSQSSASTSPCPSPVRQIQKSHRLLPTNLYVILYNFKARHADELDLKAGYKVTVIDTSDPDWWKGKLLGRVGFFPSKYCARLNAGEKPLQVTHNLQVSDGDRGENMTLLRDQIVIQTGDEVNGMVKVRSADNRQGYCPIKYLQEV